MKDNAVQSDAVAFADLGLDPAVLETLSDLGYTTPTPIQAETIPVLLGGRDLVGQAATGTGKTAAFALPIVDGIDPGADIELTALVLTPTRELAVQVSEAIVEYGKSRRAKVVAVYGGQPIYQQLKELKRGVHVVVGTPGRLIDHINRGSVDLANITTVVLDEADEMLDMGFTEDIETILERTPDERQTVMFSATMPPRINAIAKRHQNDPVKIQIARDDSEGRALIEQRVYMVARHHKAAALGRILDVEAPQSALVFCRTRSDVDDLTETMNMRGRRTEALHGGMDQQQRDRVMGRLRDGTAQLLVATDVAARGLDVDTLTHVVNYDVPTAPESYVHRIGRVGRAGREGVAITLAEPRQSRLLENIERLTKQKMLPGAVPSVADLKARQVERTISIVTEALAADDLDDYYPVLHGLSGLGDDRAILLAAIKLVHDAHAAGDDTKEIPTASRDKRDKGGKGKWDKGGKGKFDKGGKGKFDKGAKGGGKPVPGGGQVYVNLGKHAGMRPADLVGAIANETNLSGREIGPIRIADKYSVVGVPTESVDSVIAALGATSIRGKKAKARRFVD